MGNVSNLSGAILVVFLTCYLFTVLQESRRRQILIEQHGCQNPPKFHHKDPIFGLDLFLENLRNLKARRLLHGLKNRWEKYGQTFSGKTVGTRTIFTVDEKNLQTVHALKFADYGVQPLRLGPTFPFMGRGVFTTDGPFWEHSRALLRPTFTKINVANLSAFEVHLKKFFDLIPQNGTTIDLKPLLYCLFFDTTTEFLFGETMNTLSPETSFETQDFLRAFHYAQEGMGKRIQMRFLRFLHRDKKWYESIKISHAFADRYVDKALEFRHTYLKAKEAGQEEISDERNPEKQYVLLHEMAKDTNNREELRSQIIHVFIAGHDSSGITVGNAVFHLCRKPKIWEKLRAEVLSHDGTPFTFESLKNLQYLQYVIKETLRLHPVVPGDTRVACTNTVLPTGGGPDGMSPILVPKGTLVMTSLHALHRLAPCFANNLPEDFIPERWEKVRPGWSYLPFFGGPRICPGRQLALTEVAYVLARLAQEWKVIECRDDVYEWVEEMKITASSRNGVKVGLVSK